MKSKLLQKKSLNKSRASLDGQHENDSSSPTKGRETPPNRVKPGVDAQARKDFPGLLKHGYRRARS
jgi:hypothetical protein